MPQRSLRARLCRTALGALACCSALAPGIAKDSPAGHASLSISVTGIKSSKGVIRLAICPPQAGFPDCGTRAAHSAVLTIANGTARTLVPDLAQGTYAISVFHDANANGKLDTFMGIPKEGYGFSRNPPFRPRAPRFDEAAIAVAGDTRSEVQLRYIL